MALMTAATLTLTDFLLARIAEDEEWAHEAVAYGDHGVTRKWSWVRFYGHESQPTLPSSSTYFDGAPSPARVLAECEAKRRIVEREHVECAGHPGPYQPHDDYGPGYCWRADEENGTLLDLASVYADHPDYDESWRP